MKSEEEGAAARSAILRPCRKLSVVVPVFNEERSIGPLLDQVCAVPLSLELEVIAVDDCSQDATRTALAAAARRHPQVRVLSNEANRGKGFSVRRGIAEACGDLVLVQDADFEYEPNEYPLLLGPILAGEADVVYGSRFLKPENRSGFRFSNYVANRLLTRLSNLFTGFHVTDMETCYKAFRREIVQGLTLREERFGFEPEVTFQLSRVPGLRLVEVPISYRGRTHAEGKKIGWRDGMRALFVMVRSWRRRNEGGKGEARRAGSVAEGRPWRTLVFGWAGARLPWLKRAVFAVWFHGASRWCPVCGKASRRFRRFGSGGRKDACCPRCGSLERHRLVWLYLISRTDLFDGEPKRMLHVAPEPCLEPRLKARLGDGYLTADLLDPRAMVRMDVTDIRFPGDHFDVIYCSHVLEHVPDDRCALGEFYRVLRKGGWAILLVPIGADRTVEDPTIVTPAERRRVFGQEDHVRTYGPDYLDRLREAGFAVEVCRVADLVEGKEAERMGLTAVSGEIFCCRKGSGDGSSVRLEPI